MVRNICWLPFSPEVTWSYSYITALELTKQKSKRKNDYGKQRLHGWCLSHPDSTVIIALLLLAHLMPHTSLTYPATVCPESMPSGPTGTVGRETIFFIFFLTKALRVIPLYRLSSYCQAVGEMARWGQCLLRSEISVQVKHQGRQQARHPSAGQAQTRSLGLLCVSQTSELKLQ